MIPFVENEVSHLEQQFKEQLLFRKDVYYQRDIIVDFDHQRSPVGTKLFDELKKYATETGHKNLVTRTPPLNLKGIRFFEKLGYTKLFRDDNPDRIYFVMSI